ncbi:acidic fibroblast growth factor intracellular binding protein [Clonorchis sinensis]|uniref:Acidic fibroblast growth factor intracellular binding protein n=1 Tax=Clonorchis sinensis TaxID=79923 RepID=G7YD32_CLOSI|nr:acidic fibroblast growth factor intracellular binding protein [Clonorchis sinensis]
MTRMITTPGIPDHVWIMLDALLLRVAFTAPSFDDTSEQKLNLRDAFCNDLLPPRLSFEHYDLTLGTLGKKHHTLESLFSSQVMNALKPIVRLECLDGNVSVACIRTVRTHLYETFEKLLSPPGENTIFGQNHSLLFINFISKNSDWLESTRTLFAMSCLTICKALYEQHDRRFSWFCPNPCQLQTSCALEHCILRGIFTHQFRCSCPNGQVWKEEVSTCLPENEDARITNTWAPTKCEGLCYKTGTVSCYSSGVDGELTICRCKPGFTGPICSQEQNPCTEKIEHSALPSGGMVMAGDDACNVHNGNTCRGQILSDGTVHYMCICDGVRWQKNHTLGYDNCLWKKSMCDSTICTYGRCVSSASGKLAICLCMPGFEGPSCNQWVGIWSQWSPWDKCRPHCGDLRYSVRSRDCQSMKSDAKKKVDCVGASIEYASCAPHPCARSEGLYMNSYFAIRQNAMAAGLSTAAISCAIVSVFWLAFLSTMLSRTVWLLIRSIGRERTT